MEWDKLASYYAIADAYVHPGEEPYSLALVEAVIAGIPIIASAKVGSTADVLQDGINGIIMRNTESSSVYESMKTIVEEYEEFNKGAQNIKLEIIKNRSIDWAAGELYAAIKKAINK